MFLFGVFPLSCFGGLAFFSFFSVYARSHASSPFCRVIYFIAIQSLAG